MNLVSKTTIHEKVIATDLKLVNILLGLMAHGSSHPCIWCDSKKDRLHEAGALRTIGNIHEKFWRWYDSRNFAKEYGNAVHQSILKGEPNLEVIDILPPPELHFMMGPVNMIYKALEKEWPGVVSWVDACHVKRDPIHGGTFSGNGCKVLLSNIDRLRAIFLLYCLPFVKALEAFSSVIDACFSKTLKPNFLKWINDFKKYFLDLHINITPKVHAVFFHVPDFCQRHQSGLSYFSEQACESVHADFLKTWNRYKVLESNPSFSDCLIRAVLDYNSKHV